MVTSAYRPPFRTVLNRHLTLVQARSATNLANYQAPIRTESLKINKTYGRDYAGDLRQHDSLVEEFGATCQAAIAMQVADDTQLRARLRVAFESGAHADGSQPVAAAMTAIYKDEHQIAARALDAITEREEGVIDDADDKKRKGRDDGEDGPAGTRSEDRGGGENGEDGDDGGSSAIHKHARFDDGDSDSHGEGAAAAS
jgi:hypothetical protein